MRTFVLASAAVWCAGASAHAQADLFSPSAFSGLLDLRLGASQGEKSWVEGGYGKTRFSGGQDSYTFGSAATADLMWTPRLNFNTRAVVDLAIQPSQTRWIEASEAYLAYKTGPSATWSASARAGYMYPAVSLEHEGAAWSTIDTITPSAINSWAGEEVKVLGLEGTLNRRLGDEQMVSLTAGAFQNNDTSGTLLTFRGWAFHDLRATYKGSFPLPRLSAYMRTKQDPWTESSVEIDKRVGYYGRAEFRPSQSSSVHVFFYDNLGDREGVVRKQWAWDTQFWEAGTRFWLDEDTKIVAQAMSGSTLFGFVNNFGIWSDVNFASAFISGTRKFGDSAITARADWFEVNDKVQQHRDDNNERGWAATLAYKHKLTESVSVFAEGMHVFSDRYSRYYAQPRLPTEMNETTFQAALRIAL